MRLKRALRVALVLAGMAVGCAIDDTAASELPTSHVQDLSTIHGILLVP